MEDDRELYCIGPEKTYALIIGINSYPQLTAGWHLRSPVTEARQIARWLLKCGVPVSQIQCFLAESTAEAAEPLRDHHGQELRCQQPTSNLIREALLKTTLPALPEGSTLIFYWAGHGVIGRYPIQLLYGWEYSDQLRIVFNFMDIMQVLAAERWARLTRQILLVNACANLDTNGDLRYVKVDFPVKDLESYHIPRQFVLFACPLGEYAEHGQKERPTLFFEKIFGVLQQLGNSGSFSQEQLNQQIDETIKVMRPKPRMIRSGCDREIWDPPTESNDAYFNQNLARIFSQWFKEDIDLRTVGIEPFQEIFEKFFNDQKPNPESMKELMSRLISQPEDQNRSRLGKVVDFFLHVVEEFNKEKLYKMLEDLIMNPNSDQNAKLLDRKLPDRFDEFALKRVHKDIKKHRKSMEGVPPFYLSFFMTNKEDGQDFLHCIVHDGKFKEILFENNNVLIPPRAALDDVFKKFYLGTICSVLNRQPGYSGRDSEVHFRFYLPAEVMNEVPVHRFLDPRRKSSEVTVAQFSPLTLASYERATGKVGSDSLKRWEDLFKKNARVAGTELSYQSISPDWKELMRRKTVKSHHCLGFDHPPPPKLLDEMIEEGAPFLIWPLQPTDQWPHVVENLKEWIGTTTLQEAHTCLPDFRTHYPTGTDQLVVFWDDYERNGLKRLQVTMSEID